MAKGSGLLRVAELKVAALIPVRALGAVSFLVFFALSTLLIGGPTERHPNAGATKALSGGHAGIVDPRAVQLLTSRTSAADATTVRLANISTRLAVGTGNNVLIAGFIITGSQPKNVVLRGLGPAVPVLENLADPTLELHDSSGGVVGNDNWRDSQQNELKATTIPPRNDHDSAIVKSLTPGTYTAVLAGKGATTGVGLVEVYDLSLGADSRLANISTRGFVGQGDSVLIGGLIVVGSGTTNVLFRAIGPSLLSIIPNSLPDTTLELYDGQGHLLASNDNWEDSQADAIEATTIPPNHPDEAAILHSLGPGAYTAIVRGKAGVTGVAVIEAYQLN